MIDFSPVTAKFAGMSKHFSSYLLGSLACLAMFASFMEVDHRGMLFFDGNADAFALSDAEFGDGVGIHSYPLIWGTRPARPRGAQRLIPARGQAGSGPLSGSNPAAGGAGAAGSPAALADGGNAPVAGLGQPGAGGGPGGGGGGRGFPGFGSGSSPIGGFLVTPPGGGGTDDTPGGGGDGGVVPAVPEPASWLLMIIGVGALGIALRRQNSRSRQEALTA